MIYITGDTHGGFNRIKRFCNAKNTNIENDIIIITGDAGINYYEDERDDKLKQELAKLPIQIFCIHGNHEQRPSEIKSYREKNFHGGWVYAEDKYPNLLFAHDGEVYEFDDKKYLVIGGAYSVDKQYRLFRGYRWWASEQPSEKIKHQVESKCDELGYECHGIISHTCPLQYEPVEVFLPGIDQRKVDKSTEEWLDTIEKAMSYDVWYCGHYHTDKKIDKMNFMYKSIEVLK